MIPYVAMFLVVVCETEDGRAAFEDWFNALDTQAALKVTTAIDRIEAGNLGDVKPARQGVSERRMAFGPGHRLYFGQDDKKLVVLLTGGTKKRQSKDMEPARAFRADCKRIRKGGRRCHSLEVSKIR